MSRKLSCRKYRGSFVAEWSGVVRIRKLVEGVDEARNEAKRQTAKPRYLSILLDTTRPCAPLHTQEGVAVAFASCAFCVMDRKRNSSSNQGGFKHAPRFLSHAQRERVGSLPAHALLPPKKGSRYMAQRTEPHGATLRSATSGVAGCCCHTCLCKCVQCRATNGTAYPILLPLLGLISPRTPIYGVGGTNHGSSLACAAVLEGSRQTWGGQSSWSIGRTTD